MSDSKFKPSFGIETILSGDLAADSEKFLLFIKAYYEWMQTSKIEFTDKVGTFQYGETIVGSTVGATAKIKEIGIDNDLIVSIASGVSAYIFSLVVFTFICSRIYFRQVIKGIRNSIGSTIYTRISPLIPTFFMYYIHTITIQFWYYSKICFKFTQTNRTHPHSYLDQRAF